MSISLIYATTPIGSEHGSEGNSSSLTLQLLGKTHKKIYVEYWKVPTDSEATSVYDALAITLVITVTNGNGKHFVIGLGDYDYTLQNKDTALVSKPETAGATIFIW